MIAKRVARPVSPVEIVGKGTVKTTGAVCFGATSASEPNRLHLLIWDGAAHEFSCDCVSYAYRHRCRHVAALNVRLAAEREAERSKRENSMRRTAAAFSVLK